MHYITNDKLTAVLLNILTLFRFRCLPEYKANI